MQRIFMAPHEIDRNEELNTSIFLGGSIDMGSAIDWQTQVTKALEDYPVDIYNPRRPDWDSSWKQEKNNPLFLEQVLWELEAQRNADVICYFFDPNGQAPITLLELGLHINSDIVVCCPRGYWRKGNVDIVCEYHGVPVLESLDDMIAHLQDYIDCDRDWNTF
jgi:hypothetical protein